MTSYGTDSMERINLCSCHLLRILVTIDVMPDDVRDVAEYLVAMLKLVIVRFLPVDIRLNQPASLIRQDVP